jgi:hypothetical protein
MKFDSDNRLTWPEYLTLTELAAIYRISRRSAWDMTELHGLPYVATGNGTQRLRRLVHRDDVVADLTRRRRTQQTLGAQAPIGPVGEGSRRTSGRCGGFYDIFYGKRR